MDLLRDTARNAGGGGNDYSDESDDEEEESLDDWTEMQKVGDTGDISLLFFFSWC